jgi:arylsulfatase A-like enzyme
MGRFPGDVGLPGLRWFDRSRKIARMPSHSRSYVGAEMRCVDSDLDPASPTMFELVRPSIGALNVIGRGLPARNRIGRGAAFAVRAAITHFRGNVAGWLDLDRKVADEVVKRIERDKPRYTFAAFTGTDKTSHAAGQESELAIDALAIVDDTVARIRSGAESNGRWEHTHLWVCSDHGHTPVRSHDDLAGIVARSGRSVLAHPWALRSNADVAVMVSGNAMAHLYVELEQPKSPGWAALSAKWHDLLLELEARDSVDLVLLPRKSGECEVRGRGRGSAVVTYNESHYGYRHGTGNPLGIPECENLDLAEAYAITMQSDYPDGIVQIAHLARCPRSGDLILSASRDWDFRARYEPIPHVSSHGALHRDHILVPLLTSHPVSSTPRRTIDVMPSALSALGINIPPYISGDSFI